MAGVVSLLKRELEVFMDIGLKPHAIDKHGVIYKRQDVDESCLKMIGSMRLLVVVRTPCKDFVLT